MPDPTQSDLLATVVNDPTVPMVLHASKNPIPDDAGSLDLATLVECDFPGYAPVTLDTFAPTYNDDPTIGDCLTDVIRFEASDALVTPQTIWFVYVTRHPAGQPAQLMRVFGLDNPFEMNEPNKAFEIQVRASGIDYT